MVAQQRLNKKVAAKREYGCRLSKQGIILTSTTLSFPLFYSYVCPRCHNAQVVTGKSRTWFELCWIPLIPFKSKHIFICGICQWQAPQDGQFQPQVAGQPGYAHPPQGMMKPQ